MASGERRKDEVKLRGEETKKSNKTCSNEVESELKHRFT